MRRQDVADAFGRRMRTVGFCLAVALAGAVAAGCDSGSGPDTGGDVAVDTADALADTEATGDVEMDGGGDAADTAEGPTVRVVFEDPRALLPKRPNTPPTTTDIHSVDLDGNGGKQMLVTEASSKEVAWVHACSERTCSVKAKKLGQLMTPVRARDVDWDDDGDKDLIVPDVGGLMGAHEGAIALLSNDGDQNFSTSMLLEEVGQVTWAEPTDMDADGDPDLLIAIFSGPKKGLLWLEHKDDDSVTRHRISDLKGLTHVAHHDFDADGKRDIVGVFSETVEETILFRNTGNLNFEPETIMAGEDECWGLTGLRDVDMDGDGDRDLVTVNGDAYDKGCDTEKLVSRHGIDLLINDGSGNFERKRIGTLDASINAVTADFDGDGDRDVAVSSQWSEEDFNTPEPPPMVWFENDGEENFTRHPIENAPTGTTALQVTDWNDDDIPDLITGSLRFNPSKDSQRLAVIIVDRVEVQ